METSNISKVFEVAIQAMVKATPMIGPVAGILIDSARNAEAASETGELAKLSEEAKRQEISLQMAKMQAQVAQELAIAHRIENAEEVEIEEYYEGEGSAGLQGSTSGVSANFSLGGQGRKVVKRVYRFTGKNKNT
ncbi:hypothetical protein [Aeromonas taiwanensis]